LQGGYSIHVVLFIVEGHSTELQRAQPTPINDLVDDGIIEVEIITSNFSSINLQGHPTPSGEQ